MITEVFNETVLSTRNLYMKNCDIILLNKHSGLSVPLFDIIQMMRKEIESR